MSVLFPVLAWAADLSITQFSYNKSTGTVTVTVYSSVYDSTYGNVKLAVYSDAGALMELTSVEKATYDEEANGGFNFHFTVNDSSAIVPNVLDVVYLQASYNGQYTDVVEAVYTDIPVWPAGAALTGSASKSSVTLNWPAAAAQSAVSYKLFRGTSGQPFATVTSSTYTITGLSPSTMYSFSVQPVNEHEQAGTPLTGSFVTAKNDRSSSGGGGGGGYVGGADGIVTAYSDGSVDEASLKNAFANHDTVEVKTADTALLPASVLIDALANASSAQMNITADNGTYLLPLSVLKLNDLVSSLNVDAKDLKLKIEIKKVSADIADGVSSAAASVGASVLTDAVDFSLTAVTKDTAKAITSFGQTYVARTLTLDKAVNTNNVTGVLYDPAAKSLKFVPALFSEKDGKTIATLKRTGNSIYTVVEANKSFADLTNHWSKADVEYLASKLVVDGVSDSNFAPERDITRAEFAALIVRELALDGADTSSFSDVSASSWYAQEVGAAAKAGIIDGFEDGTFRPDENITREQLAAMVTRAIHFAGISTSVSGARQTEILANYKDSKDIIWAHKEIATAIDAGLMNGMTDNTIGSAQTATRAQSAVMLKRLLAIIVQA
ncbi:S-layer homology domain-containing protein [Paenibacillus sp. y28]